MFKSLKARRTLGEPTTPKMPLAPLPDTDSCAGSPIPSRPLEKRSKMTFFGRLTPDRRSSTPNPVIPSRRSKEIYVAPLRTVSMSHNDDDVAMLNLKPHKASPPHITAQPMTRNSSMTAGNPVIPKTTPKYVDAYVPSLPTQGGRGKGEHPVVCQTLRPLKSAMKGGAVQMISTTTKHDFPSISVKHRHSQAHHEPVYEVNHAVIPVEQRHSRTHHEPVYDFNHMTKHQPRSRHHSLTETRPEYPIQPSKYVPAYIKEQPPKEIILGWPLVDFALRRHLNMPPVYFDVGFDPKQDKWAVRAHRGGHSSPLTKEESEVPVSALPRVRITEMMIVCDRLANWPIHVRRSRGLRSIDVFQAIYDAYNVLLTNSEKRMIGDEYLLRCQPAFKQRCKDSPGLPLYNEECGMRRVDLLRGRRIFKGLAPIPGSSLHYKLHFDDTH